MNILFISTELPYPDYSGGRKYSWQKIRQLSKQNTVILCAFNEKEENIQEDEYKKYVKEFYFYPRQKNIKSILKNFYKPYSLISRTNANIKEKIEQLILEKKIDLIILDSIHMYYNIHGIKLNIPIYLTQHNIEYKLFKTISNKVTNPIKKIIYKVESFKLKKLEKKLYKNKIFNGYIFISNDELKEYKNEIGEVNAICIPPAIEKNLLYENKKIEENTIIFTGKMNYEPNVTATKWFLNSIFPLIQKEIPECKFYIVGKDPTEEIKNCAGNNIIVTGEVKNVYEYISKAQIVVIPLLSGGGVKLKLFDAISMEKIVISTDKGIEGTCLKNKEDLYIANEPKLFAEICVENLKKPNKEIAKNGKETLQLNYGFDRLQKRLQEFINK